MRARLVLVLRLRRERRRGGSDSGQIMLLSMTFGLIALGLVLVIASATAVHLERKQLLALADAAALDAADAIDLELFYEGGEVSLNAARTGAANAFTMPLSDSGVRDSVVAHLASAPSASGLTGLAIGEPTGTPDGSTAQVTLRAIARPPFIPWALVGWSDGIPLRVTSSARAG